MIEGFEHITKEEFGVLRDALPNIAVLIGGADGEFDSKEKRWADKMAHIYSYSKEKPLSDFFKKVADHFMDKIESLYRHLPEDPEERNEILSKELAALNEVLPKLDPHIAHRLYKSFRHFAREVAKASGGFLKIGSIEPEESKWIQLPMIEPIPEPLPGEDDW